MNALGVASIAPVHRWWIRVQPRNRRALRVGGAALAIALLYTLLGSYNRSLADLRSRLESQRDLAARELSLLADTARYPALLAARRSALRLAMPRLFDGPDMLTAAAALAQYATKEAEDAEIAVHASDSRVADPAGEDLQVVEATLHVRGDLEGVLGLLRSLEHGPRFVRVIRLDIEPDAGTTNVSGDGSASADDVETLRVALVVQGFAQARRIDALATSGQTVAATQTRLSRE